ncbi:MAG: diguanylate cyclase [Moraxellaceae bacterium]|nr:diguanylate cyclase [Moraxellaceae bacterium]
MTKQASMTWEAEYDSIRGLLMQKFLPLRFAQPFEREFRLRMREQAQITLRSYYWLLFLLFPVSYACIFYDRFEGGTWQGTVSDFASIIVVGAVTFVVVLTLSVSAFLHAFRNSYFLYVAPLTIIILTILGLNSVFLSDEVLQQRSTYPIVYIMMIVYGIANMRLVESTLIGFGSMLCVVGVVVLLDMEGMDWSLFALYFGLANFVGVANGYVVETKERRLYLQERLLQLEKRQLNNISERMVQLAREDGLTGLANRRHFSDTFLIEWERARRERLPLSVVFIDIDHFKPYNDNHGHLEGDQALVRVAKAVQLMARRAGDLAARYGGEEFVLLLPNTQANGAKEIAEELLLQVDALKLPHKASSVGPYVSISIGVATVVPDVHIAPTRLIDAADEALYEAKEGGRHRVVVSQGL